MRKKERERERERERKGKEREREREGKRVPVTSYCSFLATTALISILSRERERVPYSTATLCLCNDPSAALKCHAMRKCVKGSPPLPSPSHAPTIHSIISYMYGCMDVCLDAYFIPYHTTPHHTTPHHHPQQQIKRQASHDLPFTKQTHPQQQQQRSKSSQRPPLKSAL